MSDHELSPAQYAASVGLSDDVLERAAEAMLPLAEQTLWSNSCHCNVCLQSRADSVRAALPVLVPAIRTALIEQMLADLTAERIRYDQSPWWWRAEERVPDHASEGYVWTEETIAEALEDYRPGKPEEVVS